MNDMENKITNLQCWIVFFGVLFFWVAMFAIITDNRLDVLEGELEPKEVTITAEEYRTLLKIARGTNE